MLLLKLEPKVISAFEAEIKTSQRLRYFYTDLTQGKYTILFTYRDNYLLYEALSKDGTDYVYLEVGEDKSLNMDSRYHSTDRRFIALALYIHRKEEKLSQEELKKIYKNYYNQLAPLAKLSSADLRTRQKELNSFLDLVTTLTKQREVLLPLNEEPVTIEYDLKSEEYYYDNPHIRLLLKVSNNKNRPKMIKDLSAFLELFKAGGGDIPVNGAPISFLSKSLKEEDRTALEYLYNHGKASYRGDEKAIRKLDYKEATDLLFLLKGRQVYWETYRYDIAAEEKAVSATVEENGSISFIPSIKGKVFFGDGKAVMLLPNPAKEILLLTFPNPRIETLYKFAYENPGFRFDLFSQELSEQVIPLLSNNILVSDSFKEKHPTRLSEIHYRITYREEEYALELKTSFFVDSEEVTETVFASSEIGRIKDEGFKEALALVDLPMNGKITDTGEILRFLKTDLTPLQNYASVYLSDNLANKKVKGVGKVNIHAKSGIDWLEMELGSDLYTKEELAAILSAYKKRKKYVRLKDAFISFDDPDSKAFKDVVDDFDLSSVETERLPIYDALKLSTYSENEADILFSPELKNLFEDIKNYKKEKMNLRFDILSVLRPYQEDGVKWLHVLARHNLSGILADDMGLGKTLEMISLLATSEEQKPILIVCPKSLIYNWEKEFKQWDPFQPEVVLDGTKQDRVNVLRQIDPHKKVAYITSYESLRNDLDEVTKYSFSYVVLDEGQNIANVYAKKTRAVKEITADHKFVLTGTPIQNSYMDLWSIFDFLMPGYLPSYKDFASEYGSIEQDDKEVKDILAKKIAPFILKRKKEDVLKDLPPKTESIVTIGMSQQQRELYDATLQQARHHLEDQENKIVILAEITKLRELCVDPAMVMENYDEPSEKLVAAVEAIKQALDNGHKVLVFSTFVQTLNHLTALLNKEKLYPAMITGDTPAKERISLADAFNTQESSRIMLVSLKAGGTGLNLIGADIVLHLDPWWNLAAENQATDRSHRIGQTRPVTVLKFICKDSIEERVIELQNKKKDLTSVIQNGDKGITSLDTDDLHFLLF